MLYIQLVNFFLLQSLFSIVSTSKLDSRIFGGEKLKARTDKYLVALKITSNLGEKLKKTCSGSILDNNWIVSAAHCFISKTNEDITVERVIDDKFETIGHVCASDINIHPKYREDGSINAAKHDIALLKTNDLRNAKFIELSEKYPDVGKIVTIAGYGETESTPEPKEGKVILQRKKKIFYSIGQTWGGHGDSGGPLVSDSRLIGIISRRKCNGNKCVTYYADISSNVKWIKSVLSK